MRSSTPASGRDWKRSASVRSEAPSAVERPSKVSSEKSWSPAAACRRGSAASKVAASAPCLMARGLGVFTRRFRPSPRLAVSPRSRTCRPWLLSATTARRLAPARALASHSSRETGKSAKRRQTEPSARGKPQHSRWCRNRPVAQSSTSAATAPKEHGHEPMRGGEGGEGVMCRANGGRPAAVP